MSAIDRVFKMVHGIWRRAEESDGSIFLMAGPVSVFCSAVVGLHRPANGDLIIFAMLGMILCMRWRMRGLIYSLIIFLIEAVAKHVFFFDQHLWQIGLEGSMAIGFAMTAAAVEIIDRKEQMLLVRLDSREKTIRNLEEDLEKVRQSAIDGQITLQDRWTASQKELDESRSETSAFQVLNDVLRKSASRFNQEREETALRLIEKDRQSMALTAQMEKMREESNRFSEMIAEREFDLNRLQEQVHERSLHLNRLTESLSAAEGEKSSILARLEVAERKLKESDAAHLASVRLESENRHFAQQAAERGAALTALEERLKAMGQKEAQYLELKKQFEEKNQILHQTRAELFRADTALQAINIERENAPFEEMALIRETSTLEDELDALEKENGQLIELVSLLSAGNSVKNPVKIMERLSKIKQNQSATQAPPVKKKKKNAKETQNKTTLL